MLRYVNGEAVEMTPQEIAAFEAARPAPVAPPTSVPAWAAKAILDEDGLLAAAQAAAEGAGGAWLARYRWAPTWYRDDMLGVASLMDPPLTEQQVDAMIDRARALAA